MTQRYMVTISVGNVFVSDHEVFVFADSDDDAIAIVTLMIEATGGRTSDGVALRAELDD